MDSRGKKSAALFVAFVVAVIAAAYVAVTLIGNSHHDQDVRDANAAAKSYTTRLTAYGDSVKTALDQADPAKPDEALTLIGKISKPPVLKKLTGYGPEHSDAYAAAKGLTFGFDLTGLKGSLKEAASTGAWVKAANSALTDPLPLFPKGQFTNGDPLRKEFIPTLRKLLATYQGVKVPAGAESADKEVKSTLNFMISSASTLADRIDAQQNYNIDYRPHYKTGRDAVTGVEKDSRAKVAAAIKAAQS